MDYAVFLRSAERGEVPPVALVHGGDGQLVDDALAVVSRSLFPDTGQADLSRELMDGREVAVDVVIRSALTLPFLAPARLVVVRHCQALPEREADRLREYALHPSPTARLLLLADEPLSAGRDRKEHWLLRALPAEAVVEAPARRGRALEEWLRQRAAAEDLAVTEEASRLLVLWVGEDGATLLAEARKAALAGGPENRAVGVNEVAAVGGAHRVSGVFELARAVERSDLPLALRTLDRLLATEEPLLLLAILVREVRTAWTVRASRQRGQSVEQIARILRRPPAAIEAYAAAPPDEVLARRLRRCWEVERRLKSGGEARAEMTTLVADLCAAR